MGCRLGESTVRFLARGAVVLLSNPGPARGRTDRERADPQKVGIWRKPMADSQGLLLQLADVIALLILYQLITRQK